MPKSAKWVVFAMIIMLMVIQTGCACHKRAKLAQQARTDMIGMTKADLLSCAGVPVRSERLDNLEFLTYSAEGNTHGMFHRTRRYCEVTFTLKDGRVEKIAYNGNTGCFFNKDEQCAYVLGSCVKTE